MKSWLVTISGLETTIEEVRVLRIDTWFEMCDNALRIALRWKRLFALIKVPKLTLSQENMQERFCFAQTYKG